MKVKIDSVSKEFDRIRLSFNTSWVGDMVISQESYDGIGKPTVNDEVTVAIIVESEKR